MKGKISHISEMENKVYHISDSSTKPLCMSKFEKLMRESLGERIDRINIHYAHWEIQRLQDGAEWCLKCRETLRRLAIRRNT